VATDEKGVRTAELPHNVILEGRNRLSISGVEDVLSFDEKRVEAYTTKGLFSVSGSDLHIESLSIERGELLLEGQIDAMSYAEEYAHKGGFWANLFK